MQLRTMGELSLLGSAFRRPKPLLLLAYVSIEGATHRRDLGRLFFPNVADPADALSTTVRRLRRAAPDLVEEACQRLTTRIPCDAAEILHLLDVDAPQEALELHRGAFLAGLAAPMGEELEDWVFVTRERIASKVRRAHMRLAEEALAAGDRVAARRHADAALLLPGVPEPDRHEADRLYRLLLFTGSALASEARKIVAECIDLPSDSVGLTVPPIPDRSATSFVGRDRELQATTRFFRERQGRLLTLTGIGGVGKTRLALQTARALAGSDGFPDGIGFVPLETLRDSAQLALEIARALGLAPTNPASALQSLLDVLASRRLLLVLDNFEHLLEAAAIPAHLVRACPGIDVLVTSRTPLGLQEEHVLPLGGLRIDTDGEREQADALELFVVRANKARLGFVLREEERAAAMAIVRAVDGHPLAIELAASWVRTMTVDAIAEQLAMGTDLLVATTGDVADRHRSVRAVLEHAWRVLPPHQRGVLAALSVFAGGFRPDAAIRVCGASLGDLAALVDASLLSPSPDGRYQLHPWVSAFAAERLHDDPDEEAAQRSRHGAYVFGLFEQLADERPSGMSGPAERRQLDAELDNLRAAWRWSAEMAPRHLQRSLAIMWRYFITQPRCAEGLAMASDALTRIDVRVPGGRGARAAVLLLHAVCSWWMGDYEAMAPQVEEGLALMREVDDPLGVEFGLGANGAHAWRTGAFSEARRSFEEALAIARRLDHRVSRNLQNLAHAERTLGNFARSRTLFEEAIALNRRDGKLDYLAGDLSNLALVVALEGDLERAQVLVDEALECGRTIGKTGHHLPLAAARVALMRHELALCRGFARDVVETPEPGTSTMGTIEALLLLARCDILEAKTQEAWAHLERALRASLRTRALPMMLMGLIEDAFLLTRIDRVDDAVPVLLAIARNEKAEAPVRLEARQLLDAARPHVPTLPLHHEAMRVDVAVRVALWRGESCFGHAGAT
jgi:predicted ATPase